MPNSNWSLTYGDATYSVTYVEAQRIQALVTSILAGTALPQPYTFRPAGQDFESGLEVTVQLGDSNAFDLKPEELFWKGYDA